MKYNDLRPDDSVGKQQMEREVRHALQQVRKGAARSWMVTPLPDRTPASHVFFSTTVRAAVQNWMEHLNEMSGPFDFGPPAWSLTHSGAWGAFAAGRNAIGIDIEVDRDLMNPRRLWDRIAHHSEHELAQRHLDPNPLQGLWTAKEAVSKGMGLGITMDFRDMRWEPNGRGAIVLVEQAGAPPRHWDVEQVRGPGYWLAVATEVDTPSQISRFLRESS